MNTEQIIETMSDDITKLVDALAVLKLIDYRADEIDTTGQLGGAADAAHRLVESVHQSLHVLAVDIGVEAEKTAQVG